jgi:hypothetical protein
MGTLPAPRRTRDYRLTAEQAAALRPSGWRRLLAPLAGPRFRLAAPLGTTMATLGVAAFLIAALPGAPLAGMASTPAGGGPQSAIDRDASAPPPEPSMAAPAASAAAPSATAPSGLAGEQSPLVVDTESGTGQSQTEDTTGDGGDGRVEPLSATERTAEAFAVRAADETVVIVGGMLVLLGVALLALRWTARRLA